MCGDYSSGRCVDPCQYSRCVAFRCRHPCIREYREYTAAGEVAVLAALANCQSICVSVCLRYRGINDGIGIGTSVYMYVCMYMY